MSWHTAGPLIGIRLQFVLRTHEKQLGGLFASHEGSHSCTGIRASPALFSQRDLAVWWFKTPSQRRPEGRPIQNTDAGANLSPPRLQLSLLFLGSMQRGECTLEKLGQAAGAWSVPVSMELVASREGRRPAGQATRLNTPTDAHASSTQLVWRTPLQPRVNPPRQAPAEGCCQRSCKGDVRD